MLNRVVLIGRLTRDPELKTTASGKSVVDFSIAVQKRIKPAEGPDADFFRITAWEKTAEFVANYLHKGRLVSVDGRLQSRKYTTTDGQNREVVEIVADSVQSLDRPREDAAGGGAEPVGVAAGSTSAPSADEYDPFADE
ncbi:MAG: single-stranded DNA-binding protein [Fimbriimonas ginsengisoli]|uniref:Single-stranded DNA-binding protein n=1 Tax=Fimbriimonas ginsengisoli TaxID=1005039 RepID=A0A931PTV9_FIMGI|nr:single-stranded DNA-binding protein [Fimbriimonas ginsengisoli]MBI3721337.1 single-stranded DNA-binding protein [Fimbriimonas ginsengisoli]